MKTASISASAARGKSAVDSCSTIRSTDNQIADRSTDPSRAQVLAEQIRAVALSPAHRRGVIASNKRLQLDRQDSARIARHETALADGATLIDNAFVAAAAAQVIGARRVMEIGVRRGFAAAAIAGVVPAADLYLLDMWGATYAGEPNPGPTLVHQQLRAVNHTGTPIFLWGKSRDVLPRLFASQPHLTFDLLIVDGDHTLDGARYDLNMAFDRVAPGGVLVFDDLVHPQHLYLNDLWAEFAKSRGDEFAFQTWTETGMGIGWAVREGGIDDQ
jgi:predicted O-methyltransferase YrrM